jgi:ferric citrate transport system substrate-binding protein
VLKLFLGIFLFIVILPAKGLGTIVIPHQLGKTLLKGPAKKVVALEFSFVDALVSLGTPPVGIADDGDPTRIIRPWKKKLSQWKSVGLRKAPNLELILTLAPDLIIADLRRHKNIYPQLSQMAPTILLDSLGEDYTADLQSLKVIAQALGKEKTLPLLLEEHEKKILSFTKKLSHLRGRTLLFAVSWEEGVHLHTLSGYVPELLQKLQLTYAPFPQELTFSKASEKVTLEHLLTVNPDILILARSRPHVLFDEWKKSPLWPHLKAQQKKQIYSVDQTLWTRARGVLAAEEIMQDLVDQLKALP